MKDMLGTAVTAAEAASKEILSVYYSTDFETQSKSDNSPLTIADTRAHECIVKHLEQTDIPILSEEGMDIPYETRKGWKQFWLVDPLDGTREFIKRNHEFTVNIALIEGQRPVLGVVAVPVTGALYYGGNGLGVFKREASSVPGYQLQVPNRYPPVTGNLRPVTKVVASRSHMNTETADFIAKLGESEVMTAGSSLKFMLLAEGKADIYPRFGPTMEWDTAAAHAILNALGIKVMTTDGSKELQYNKPNLLNPYFVAGFTPNYKP